MSVYFHVVDVKTRSDGEKLVLSSYVLSIILIMLMLINTPRGTYERHEFSASIRFLIEETIEKSEMAPVFLECHSLNRISGLIDYFL